MGDIKNNSLPSHLISTLTIEKYRNQELLNLQLNTNHSIELNINLIS